MTTATQLESVIGMAYADATKALAQHDWKNFYPVVEDGVIVAIADASDTRYTIVDDAYMTRRHPTGCSCGDMECESFRATIL